MLHISTGYSSYDGCKVMEFEDFYRANKRRDRIGKYLYLFILFYRMTVYHHPYFLQTPLYLPLPIYSQLSWKHKIRLASLSFTKMM